MTSLASRFESAVPVQWNREESEAFATLLRQRFGDGTVNRAAFEAWVVDWSKEEDLRYFLGVSILLPRALALFVKSELSRCARISGHPAQ